jgi:hypothetical protein
MDSILSTQYCADLNGGIELTFGMVSNEFKKGSWRATDIGDENTKRSNVNEGDSWSGPHRNQERF